MSIDTIPTELLLHIYEMLPLINKVTMARAYARLWRLTDPIGRSVLMALYGASNKKLIDAILKHGGAITGGVLLYALGLASDFGDIDAVFADQCVLSADIAPDGYLRYSGFLAAVYGDGAQTISQTKQMILDGMRFGARKIQYNGCTVDLITAELGLRGYIDSFDLDICKNTFDGTLTVGSFRALLTKTITIVNLLTGTSPQSLLEYVEVLGNRTHERCIKYMARGFTVSNPELVFPPDS